MFPLAVLIHFLSSQTPVHSLSKHSNLEFFSELLYIFLRSWNAFPVSSHLCSKVSLSCLYWLEVLWNAFISFIYTVWKTLSFLEQVHLLWVKVLINFLESPILLGQLPSMSFLFREMMNSVPFLQAQVQTKTVAPLEIPQLCVCSFLTLQSLPAQFLIFHSKTQLSFLALQGS